MRNEVMKTETAPTTSDKPSLCNAYQKCINILSNNNITIPSQKEPEPELEQEQEQKAVNNQFQFRFSTPVAAILSSTAIDAIYAAQYVQEQRNNALDQFLSRWNNENDASSASVSPLDSVVCSGSSSLKDNLPIPTKTATATAAQTNNPKTSMTSLQFKKSYIHSNIPCLIRGLHESDFARVTSMWTTSTGATPTNTTNSSSTPTCVSTPTTAIPCKIETEWFLQNVGPNTLVPVRRKRQQRSSSPTPSLDEEGRAEECVTIEMPMHEWIHKCGDGHRCGNEEEEDSLTINTSLYLKDWHLQLMLEYPKTTTEEIDFFRCDKKILSGIGKKNEIKTTTATAATLPSQQHQRRQKKSLYEVPDIFSRDLLNPFLLTYYQNCDYRFIYWGPNGSTTPLHSDVLHTFSWSYNVCGRKRWTFYPPRSELRITGREDYRFHNDDKGQDSCDNLDQNDYPTVNTIHHVKESFEVIQNAGETMYVPSTWKHSVINLPAADIAGTDGGEREVEGITLANIKKNQNSSSSNSTLSINHNWITAVALDQMLQCITVEMKAVEEEMKAWEIDLEDFLAKESMLRGCIGLNMSMFVLMVLTNLIECMDSLGLLVCLNTMVTCDEEDRTAQSQQDFWNNMGEGKDITDDKEWELWFDVVCMVRVLLSIMDMDHHRGCKQGDNVDSDSLGEVGLKSRLEAVLEDKIMASQTIGMINLVCGLCDILIKYTITDLAEDVNTK